MIAYGRYVMLVRVGSIKPCHLRVQQRWGLPSVPRVWFGLRETRLRGDRDVDHVLGIDPAKSARPSGGSFTRTTPGAHRLVNVASPQHPSVRATAAFVGPSTSYHLAAIL